MTGATARFPRTHRLLAPADYRRVFRNTEITSRDRLLTVLAVANALQHPRLGTAVSVKSAGNTVRRNRIKRLIRESFRQYQALLNGYDVVVLARPGIAARSNQEIYRALETHWRSIAAHAQTGSDNH